MRFRRDFAVANTVVVVEVVNVVTRGGDSGVVAVVPVLMMAVVVVVVVVVVVMVVITMAVEVSYCRASRKLKARPKIYRNTQIYNTTRKRVQDARNSPRIPQNVPRLSKSSKVF